LFPEGKFHQVFLSEVANLLIHPGGKQNLIIHNKGAIRARYSVASLKNTFERLLNQLYKMD
jgi:hypothetical protein